MFQNDSVATMIARIIGICGPFPKHVMRACVESRKYFTASGVVFERSPESGQLALIYPKKTTLAARLHLLPSGGRSHDDDLFLDFVNRLLDLDPVMRPTASEALRHPWLADADELVVSAPNLTVA